MKYSLLTVVCGVAFLLLAVTGANCLYVLELVQVAHQIGVAPPAANEPNHSKMCSPDGKSNCSAIANRGVEQAKAMGTHILGIYNGDKKTSGSDTWFGSQYDPSIVHTRASADPSTVQAATALLKGLYASENALTAPVVISTALDKDTLLNVDAFPSLNVMNEMNKSALNNILEAVVDKQFPDSSVLSAMGAEVGLEAVCSVPANRVSCCYQLQKLARMYAATGTASSAPKVTASRAKLDAVATARFQALYGYDAGVPLKAARGSLGQPLVQEMLRNMRHKMLSKTDPDYNAKKVIQYAHHVPIRTTLGYKPGDETPLVETFLMDLLRNDGTNDFFVRLRYATVGEGTSNAASASFPFRCLNAAGVPTDAKTAEGIICPIDDFGRFVESSAGQSQAGAACYLDEDTKKQFGCSVEGEAPSKLCAAYRAMCPSQACPEGKVYDPTDNFCKTRVVLGDVMLYDWALTVAVFALLGGFLVAVFLMHLCPLFLMRVSRKKSGVPSE